MKEDTPEKEESPLQENSYIPQYLQLKNELKAKISSRKYILRKGYTSNILRVIYT